MADTPDVRVRLSAEGVQEVISAMQKVQAEAKKTDGIDALTKGFEDLKSSLLDGITVAAAVDGMVELGKTAIDNAVHIGALSQETGASVEVLSDLSVAAKQADVSQETMSSGLIKLAHNMDLAAKGAAQPLDAFRRMGISMKDIKTNDPGQMFVLLSQKMAGIEGGAKRAALAQDLLGKSGADLIPLMDKLANGGFAEVQAQARAMGLELTQQTLDAIKKAHDSLTDLQLIAEGVATQFMTGFAPKASDALKNLSDAINQNGINGAQKLGEFFGQAAKNVVFSLTVIGQTIGAVFGSVIQAVTTTWNEILSVSKGGIEALKALAQGNFSGARDAFNNGLDNAVNIGIAGGDTQRDIYSRLSAQVKADWQKRTADGKSSGSPNPGAGGGGTDEGNLTAIQKARLALLQAQADNELAITKLKNQLEGQDNDASYKDGLISLQDYYDKRAELIAKDRDAEIADLQKKKKDLEAQPTNNTVEALNKQKEIAALDAKITEAKLQADGKEKQNEEDRHNAVIQHREQELDLESKIAAAEGDRDKAAQLALDAELLRTEDLLRKQGMAADQIKKILDDMRSAGEGKIGFDSASRQGQEANSDLDLAKRDIQRQLDTGQINYIQAQAQTLQLENDRVATLKQIGAEMTANAEKSKDPSLIEQAKQFNAAVQDIEASTNLVGKALADLQNTSIQGAITSFSTFIGDAVSGAKSFKDAWADLEKGFEQIISQMIAKLVEMYLMMLLMNLIAPGAGASGSGSGSAGFASFANANGGIDIPMFDSGGYTGNAARNKIAGVVHGQEFVVNALATQQFRPLLEMMNVGAMRGIAPMRGGYMAGGYVSGQGGSAVEVNIQNHTGQPATQTQSTTPDGRQIIQVMIGEVAADIARGGKVAQTLDSTYGIRRGGIKRG